MSGPHFLIRSPPHPDESGLGYLARLAFVNGRRSVLEVVDVPRNKITLSELAYRIGIPITVLRCALPPWPAWIIDRWGISGLAGRLYFNLKRMRFCPYCFAEAPYLSQASVKLFSVACPIHRVVLRDSCDQCGRTFEWRYAPFGECKCGRRFQDMVSPASTPWASCVARSQAAADARRSGSLEYLNEYIPACLHGDHLCALLLAFGPLLDGRATGKTGASAGLCEVQNAVVYVQQAAEILSEWPDRFHAYLDRCLENAAETLSLRQAIGPAYRILYSPRLRDSAFEFLRTELRSYMEGHWRGRIDGRHRRFGGGSHSNDVLAGASLRSAMRMRRENILELTSSCVLPAKLLRSRSGRAFVYCQRRDVVALRTQLDGTMDLRAAAHYLGIGRSRLYDLLEHGVLRGERSAGRWKILRGAVVAFSSFPAARRKATDIRDNFVSVGHALKYVHMDAPVAVELLRRIRDGELHHYGPTPGRNIFSSFQLRRSDVNDIRAEYHQRSPSGYSALQVAEKLSIKPEVIYHLINVGLLKCEEVTIDGRRQRIVSNEAMLAFSRNFLALRIIADRWGVSPRHALKMLTDCGISPATGPTLDGCRQYFFARNAMGQVR